MNQELKKNEVKYTPDRIIRPRVGDVWAFGSPTGRRVIIKRIAFGAAGKWLIDKGKAVHIAGPRRRLYVHADAVVPQTVASWLTSWHFVSRANNGKQPQSAENGGTERKMNNS